jgi:hypothetical protein
MHQGNLTILSAACSGLALLVLGGCGGGGGSSASAPAAYASVLSYSNPPLGGYSLQAEPASNHTARLVLDLVGPAGTVARGVSFFLTADPAMVAWSPQGSAYAVPGTAFSLGPAPQAFVAKAAAGNLQVGIFQKSGAATYGSAPLVQVALDLKAGVVLPGSTVALGPSAGLGPVLVDANGAVQPFPAAIAVGALTAE